MSELGDYLRKLRGRLSLREAAKRSGLSHSYIDSLEKGVHPRTGATINPSPDILRSLARAYGEQYSDLMKIAGYADESINGTDDVVITEYDQKLKEIERLIRKITKDMGPDATAAFLKQLAGEK